MLAKNCEQGRRAYDKAKSRSERFRDGLQIGICRACIDVRFNAVDGDLVPYNDVSVKGQEEQSCGLYVDVGSNGHS